MGTDIHGWVEVREVWEGQPSQDATWYGVVNIGLLASRDYDAFGCLFGVKNYAHVVPIAPDRGVPDDASAAVREAIVRPAWMTDAVYAEAVHSASWPGADERAAADRDERAPLADSCIHRYERDSTGQLQFRSTAAGPPGRAPSPSGSACAPKRPSSRHGSTRRGLSGRSTAASTARSGSAGATPSTPAGAHSSSSRRC